MSKKKMVYTKEAKKKLQQARAYAELQAACNGLLNSVREKHNVEGDDFDCPHMRAIAAALTKTEELSP